VRDVAEHHQQGDAQQAAEDELHAEEREAVTTNLDREVPPRVQCRGDEGQDGGGQHVVSRSSRITP
jgi:hypothetical protein